jgi:hypothetical protein
LNLALVAHRRGCCSSDAPVPAHRPSPLRIGIMARRRWRDRGRHASPPPPTPPTARALAGPRPPSWTPPRRPRRGRAGGGPSARGADRAGAAFDDGDSRSRSDSRSPVRVDFAAHGRPVCKRTPQPPAAQAPLHFTIQVHGRRGAARSRRCRASAVDGSSSSSTIATAPPVVITMELSQDEADLVQALRRELARAP